MNLIKPEKLKSGDTIEIIAPSGEVDRNKIETAKNYFENKGFNVKLSRNLFKCKNYLAGDDDARLNDLHNAFLDTDVNAIICARGGYGAIRLINKIDYNIIKNNPKIFCGYSDITALSVMILKKSGLITFSGPMAQSTFGNININPHTEKTFWNTLDNVEIKIFPKKLKTYKSGTCKGLLFGGNLSTLTSLCGVDFIPDKKFIFFCEDLNEPVYKIDRYLTQLLNIPEFGQNLSGIILGDFLGVDNKKWLDDLFIEIAENTNVPVLGGYPISHDLINSTIPCGGAAELLEDGTIAVKY